MAVVDYGMGNLRSVAKPLEHVAPGAEVLATADPAAIRSAERVVVPGQGAMPDCMRQLAASGAREAVIEAAGAKPFLGICIGLQMLFERGEEGDTRGLGLLPGNVPRFRVSGLKIPHMGWNEVLQRRRHALWAGIADRSRFYFVHSYFPAPRDEGLTAATCVYGMPFTCAVAGLNVLAFSCLREKGHMPARHFPPSSVPWLAAFQCGHW